MRAVTDFVWSGGERNRRLGVYRPCRCGTRTKTQSGVGYLSFSDARGRGLTVWLSSEQVFQGLDRAIARLQDGREKESENGRMRKILSEKNLPGPLESLPLKSYCEMCGERSGRDALHGDLEAGFDPSGRAMTLCRACRAGSAESREAQFINLLEAFQAVLSDYQRAAQQYPKHRSVGFG